MVQSTEQITNVKITYRDILSDSTEFDVFELPFNKDDVVKSLSNYNKLGLLEITDINNQTIFIFTDTIAKIEVY